MTKVALEGDHLLLDGAFYLDVLARLHATFEPRSYLEIGTLGGDTLRLGRCPTIAVDPAFALKPGVVGQNTQAQLFEMTSDAFFAAHDPARKLGRRIDLAFLDGMHEFDFLLRDFINTERHCAPGSIIVMHDCLPGDAWMTRPHRDVALPGQTRFPGYWTGDVWKIVPILKAERPDLQITCLDALPTGLVMVQSLDPSSRALEGRLDVLVETWGPVQLADYGLARMIGDMDPQSAEDWLASLRSVRLTTRLKRKLRSAAIRGRQAVKGARDRLDFAAAR